jgi:cytochrome oxidase Cu insertion factor (SCO1/SenC/PrrC family)
MLSGIKFFILTTLLGCASLCLVPSSYAQQTTGSGQNKPAAPAAPVKLESNDHSEEHGHGAKKQVSTAEKYFSDVVLLDQNGKSHRFYNDVLKGKTVIINAMFTSCTNVCPLMNRNFEKIQDALGDRLGKDVFLISLSVDPANDTPERLHEYAKRFKAKPGWLFLTGKKENVDWALYKLGQYTEKPDGHKSIILIGNEPTGVWKKAFGLAQSHELIALVEEVLAAK